jgi:hypothetical protein
MDDPLARLVALEQVVRDLQDQLDALKPSRRAASVICLKEAVARSGWSRHTLVRRALTDPSLGSKRGGVWEIDAERLSALR